MLLLVSAVIIGVLILAFKLFPAYTQYLAVNRAITDIARNPETRSSVGEIHTAFNRRAVIDDITVVQGSDLEIARQGDRVT